MKASEQPRTSNNGLFAETHGKWGTPTYHTWDGMKQRCLNPNSDNYSYYGGRGISICKEWLTFSGFYEDMGSKPPGLTLDRIDGEGDYTVTNCRWVSRKKQSENRKVVHMITIGRTTLCQEDWAKEVGIAPMTIRRRISKGWTEAQSIFTPAYGERLVLS